MSVILKQFYIFRFHLNTSIDFPHQKCINKVLFQPTNKDANLKCITISQDLKYKVWEITEVKTLDRELYIFNERILLFNKTLQILDFLGDVPERLTTKI